MKTFCFKLYKSDRNNKLNKQIDAAGLIYNHCIALCKRYYKIFHKSLNPNRLKVHLTKPAGSLMNQPILCHGRQKFWSHNTNRPHSGFKYVGYDFGLKKFLTASDGADVTSPLFFAQNAALIAKAAKNLSHKVKGSNNRRRAKYTLANLYKKSANQRHDFHFKLAHRLCK